MQEISERSAEPERFSQYMESQVERLKEQDQSKSHFFLNISHEIRKLLTLIRGPLEDLTAARYGELSSSVVTHLNLSLHNTRKLQTLIDELLTLSKLEAGRLQLNAVSGPLVSTIRRYISNFSQLAKQTGVDLRLQTDSVEINLSFDAEKLEKIISHLLANSLKFTPPGGWVSVSIEAEVPVVTDAGSFVRIRVEDNGPGIERNILPHVFERFYQGLSPDIAEGTGIGLALVKELTELHGGEVQVESMQGQGAFFTVLLPVEKAHTRDKTILPAATMTAQAQPMTYDQLQLPGSAAEPRHRVLLVVDNLDTRAYLRGHLAPDYQVLEAENGAEGLRQARQLAPALIISNVMMPIMDGFTFVKALRADEALSHLPVILLSARSDPDDRLAGLKAGADDYMANPFSIEELLLRVTNFINSRAALREYYAKSVVAVPIEKLESADTLFLKKARNAVKRNLADAAFDVESLAKAMFVSEQTLRRRLDALVGVTPAVFIRQLRLTHAHRLLENREVTSLKQAAFSVGFRSTAHFARLFRHHFGYSVQDLLRRKTPRCERIS